MSRSRLRLATRGSALALRQTDIVAELLRDAHEGIEIEVVEVSTRGDRDRRSFAAIGAKGIFVAEVEQAILDGRADAAVHSAKDLTADLASGCAIVCAPPRGAVADAVVGGKGSSGEARLGSLPPGALVGTSSLRRRALLAEVRPDLDAVELRGNLDTRIRKVSEDQVDAAIVAAAGLERLGAPDEGASLDPEMWVPSPGQGVLAIEAVTTRDDVAELFASVTDQRALAELRAERSFSRALEGGCSVPLGCRAVASSTGLVVNGWIGLPDGSRSMRDKISGGLGEPVVLGEELARAMLDCGGRELLEELAEFESPEVQPP